MEILAWAGILSALAVLLREVRLMMVEIRRWAKPPPAASKTPPEERALGVSRGGFLGGANAHLHSLEAQAAHVRHQRYEFDVSFFPALAVVGQTHNGRALEVCQLPTKPSGVHELVGHVAEVEVSR